MLFLTIFIAANSLFAQSWKTVDQNRQQLNNKFRRAVRLENQGKDEQALEIYAFIFEQSPETPNYYQRYVKLLLQENQLDAAETAIQKYSQLKPLDPEPGIDLGRIYYMRNDTTGAFHQWDNLLKKFNYNVSVYRGIYYGLVSIQLLNEAVEYLKQARSYHKQPDLFAMELADIYQAQGRYVKSFQELLVFGKQRSNYSYVTRQVLRFPKSEKLYSQVDSLLTHAIQKDIENPQMYLIQSEMAFSYQHFEKAAETAFLAEQYSGNSGKHVFNLADDMLKEHEFQQSEDIYTRIIENPAMLKLSAKAMLGLADVAEKSAVYSIHNNPLDYLYPDNIFFKTDFISSIEPERVNNLARAFKLYDSLIAVNPGSKYSDEALFRLGKLRYQVSRDFDGAVPYFQKVAHRGKQQELKQAAEIMFGKLMLANGETEKAVDYFSKKKVTHEGRDTEKDFAIYEMFSLYFDGKIDSMLARKTDVLGLIGIKSEYFNDVLELTALAEFGYEEADAAGKLAFLNFIEGEKYIQQDRLNMAGEIYKQTLRDYPDSPIAIAARFRQGQIMLCMNDFGAAETALEPIMDNENEFRDKAAFMLAQAALNDFNDTEAANRWYRFIIEKCPDSFYYEIARKQLRELRNES